MRTLQSYLLLVTVKYTVKALHYDGYLVKTLLEITCWKSYVLKSTQIPPPFPLWCTYTHVHVHVLTTLNKLT